jgi:hypothetical protein
MNKRLEKEFGEHLAEKRGWHWAITLFVLKLGAKLKNGLNYIFNRFQVSNKFSG